MLKPLQIGGKTVGDGCPVFIIAEAGVNHNGDLSLALELIEQASRCGVDCIKFQTFTASKIVTPGAPKARYQQVNTDIAESQLAMLRKLEMPTEWYAVLTEACQNNGLIFLSTPYDVSDIEFLEHVGVPAYKVASALAVEPIFLRRLAKTGKPILLSTGMCTMVEVAQAVQTLRNAGNDKIILLQCTTNYPSDTRDCNLRTIKGMRDSFDVLTGYSDHTQGLEAAMVAVGLGACVIERHFTLNTTLPGPDHSSSSDPAEMAHLVSTVKNVEQMLGCAKKIPCASELVNKQSMRRSIVAACDITAGTIVTAEMLGCKRPATGVSPSHIPHMIGRVAQQDIPQDTFVRFSMLGPSIIPECTTVKQVQASGSDQLKNLFAEIAASEEDVAYFHPHPFTAEQAEKYLNYTGRDKYLLFMLDGTIVGYGMLRGWDEGFDIPSLGIYIRRQFRGTGIASACMRLLHDVARKEGAATVRLTVGVDNPRAAHLYEAHGYVEVGREEGYRIMHVHI